jgi:hypothetical protein
MKSNHTSSFEGGVNLIGRKLLSFTEPKFCFLQDLALSYACNAETQKKFVQRSLLPFLSSSLLPLACPAAGAAVLCLCLDKRSKGGIHKQVGNSAR